MFMNVPRGRVSPDERVRGDFTMRLNATGRVSWKAPQLKVTTGEELADLV